MEPHGPGTGITPEAREPHDRSGSQDDSGDVNGKELANGRVDSLCPVPGGDEAAVGGDSSGGGPGICAHAPGVVPGRASGAVPGAPFGAIQSTTSSVPNSTSTIITVDIHKRTLRKSASERHMVLVGRLSSVVVMVAAAVLGAFIGRPGHGPIDNQLEKTEYPRAAWHAPVCERMPLVGPVCGDHCRIDSRVFGTDLVKDTV